MTKASLINDPAVVAQICEQCNLGPQDIEDAYPCTPVQSGMMVDSALYVHNIVHKINADVDLDRLNHAIGCIIAKNHVLRTRIVDCDGFGLIQAVARNGQPVLRSETGIDHFLKWNASLSTELGAPLARFVIVVDDDGNRLVTTMHHAIFDFHVLQFLVEDIWSVYQAISPSERVPFKVFVEQCSSIDVKEATNFWKKRFTGGVSVFPSIPAGQKPVAREIITREISLSNEKAKTTLPLALMPAYIEAAWALTVSDYTCNDSIAFGCVLSGRGPGALGGAETTFGPTITSIPVQVNIRRNATIQKFIKDRVASRREISTSRFLQFGLSKIRNVSEAAQSASNFQSALSIVYRSHTKGLGTSGFRLDEAHTEEPPKPHGILLLCTPSESQVHVKTLFDPDVLESEQVHRVIRQLEHRLRQLISSAPSTPLKKLTAMNFGDTLEIMDWNTRHFPTRPIEERLDIRIAARAVDHPDDLAVDAWDGKATYAELMAMTDNLAQAIITNYGHVAREESVCIIIGRSLSLVVAFLSIMRVGGICVPIDPNIPDARKKAIISQCQARLVLTPPEPSDPRFERDNCLVFPIVLDRRIDAPKTTDSIPTNTSASSAAFMIFTSGSTGQPKGVVLEHKSFASSTSAWTNAIGWYERSRVLQYSTPSFDACAGEIMGSLQAGACVCIPSDRDRESGLGEYIKSKSVNHVALTPTTLRTLSPQDVPSLKTVASIGEPITQDIFETWSHKVHLVNAWGPTEGSVVSSMGHLAPDARYPDTIGRPMGCALWIVDPDDVNRLLPIGTAGEILIEGPGVAREYYMAPDLTKASFIEPPFFLPLRDTSVRSTYLYRTGDLARHNADGSICFLGRRDNQVKIRGQRFELGEVESLISSHRFISDVVVITHLDSPDAVTKDLVAILALSSNITEQTSSVNMNTITLDNNSCDALGDIQTFTKSRLPSFMVPTVWLIVEGLPHTPSKKVDRVKIKAWFDTMDMQAARRSSQLSSTPRQSHQDLTPPETAIETALQEVWSKVFRIDSSKIGRESSFMLLGGDSISAMQVATRCRKKGLQISVADLLRKNTLAESAMEVHVVQDPLLMSAPTMNESEASQLRPLSPIQEFLSMCNGPASQNQFNQAFLLDINPRLGSTVTHDNVKRALGMIVEHHSMLRARFTPVEKPTGEATLNQHIAPIQDGVECQDTWAFRLHENVASNDQLLSIISNSQTNLNIFEGPVFSADVIINKEGQMSLFLAAHHLVTDLVSWRILWEDLEAILEDETYTLPYSVPFPLYVQGQHDAMEKATAPIPPVWPKSDRVYWGMEGVNSTIKDMARLQYTLSQQQTGQIMGESCNLQFTTSPVVLLLTAVVLSFMRAFPDRGTPSLYNESHGREADENDKSLDVSRTIGWFTTLFPLPLSDLKNDCSVENAIMAIKDGYRSASKTVSKVFASQVLSTQSPSSFRRSDIELAFNFAGRMQQVTREDSLLRLRSDGFSVDLENVAADCEVAGLMSIYASIDQDEKLTLTLDYNRHMAHQDRITHWMQKEMGDCFTEMISTLRARSFTLTAIDLPLLNMNPGIAGVEFLHSRLKELGVAQDNVESIYPCTATQDGMLFANLNGYDYHNRFAARITSSKGYVDIDRLIGAWKAACGAHPVLRTIFTSGLSEQSAFQQIVLKNCQPSVTVVSPSSNRQTIMESASGHRKPSLSHTQPPHDLTLYQESDSVVHMIVDISHTLIDARTFQDFFHTIGLAYSSDDMVAVAPGRPFSDYVVWLHDQQEESHEYWRKYLQGVGPCVFPRDPLATVDYQARGPIVPFNDAKQLSQFCQQHGVTHAMFMQAAWALVLKKHTAKSTICFGSVRSDQEVLPGNNGPTGILGPLISMLPCRFDIEHLDSITARDILEIARNDVSRSMRYSGCYLAEIHDELGLRDTPLFDTIMTIQRAWSTDLGHGSGDLSIKITDADDPTEYSIVVGVQYSDTGLTIGLSYQRANVSDSMVQDIAKTFASVIKFMIQSPDKPLMTILDSRSAAPDIQLLSQWNAKPPIASASDENIASFFRAMAQSQGSAPAVCSWECDLNYRELDLLSDRLAYKLRVKHGVRGDDIVPFCCIKAASAIVTMLAIWKSGAGLLPLDFSHPSDRIAGILKETRAKLVLVNATERMEKMQQCFANGTVDLVSMEDLEAFDKPYDVIQHELSSFSIDPQHVGYVVYTSGSTGTPKGLILHQRSIATSTMYHAPRLGLTPESRVLQLTNFVFDFGLLDVMFSLYAGACICMPSEEEATNDVSGAVRRTNANYVECTPTYASLLNPENAPSLRTVVFAGEGIKQENIDTWFSQARIMNGYGPGEVGMSSCGDVPINGDRSFDQDIGAPFGCRYWVVDPDNHDELVPIGTTGELVIEGPIVGRGYVNNPEALAAAFIDPPAWTRYPDFASRDLGQYRFYKSGDLVKQRSSDSFIFEGRKDYQVKIRGQRIEMGEIEHHLNSTSLGVSRWVVEVIQAGTGQEIALAAFCEVIEDNAMLSNEQNILPPRPVLADEARNVLRQVIPSYMVPEFFVPLLKIPTTGSMKTDRKSLRAIAGSLGQKGSMIYRATGQRKPDMASNRAVCPVLTDLESILSKSWTDILNLPKGSIQPDDDFFALGGNSIRAMRLVANLRACGYLLSVSDIFKYPICEKMALRLCPFARHHGVPKSKPAGMVPQDISQLGSLVRNNSLFGSGNIEAIAPATDLQATMLAEAHRPGGGSMVAAITLEPLAQGKQTKLEMAKLQESCEQVIRSTAILRTVFIQNDNSLYQVALHDTQCDQVHVLSPGQDNTHGVSASSDILNVLPHFELMSNEDGTECVRLTIIIHHAHYDAISMGHLLEDLKDSYSGTGTIRRQPSFHEWACEVSSPEKTIETRRFWKGMLEGSTLHSLAPYGVTEQENGDPDLQQHVKPITIPSANIQSPHGTGATVLKAAWSCVLSQIFGQQDPTFAFLSANRFQSDSHHGSAEQVAGPCINLIPTRAPMGDPKRTMVTLIQDLQQQSNDSLAHQHLGFRSIIRDCTEWSTTRFNSAILFQNHESLGNTLQFGEIECTVMGAGQGTSSADVWVIATPQPDQTIAITLNFSRDRVPTKLCEWISHCLEMLVENLPSWWEWAIGDIGEELVKQVGANPMPIALDGNITQERSSFDDVVDRVLQAGHFKYV